MFKLKSLLKKIPGVQTLYRFILRLWHCILYTPTKRLNIYKTVLVNFSLLPLRQACRFPVYIYGKVAVYNLSGHAFIEGPISRGMIKFGYNHDMFSASNGSAMLRITGTIMFRGMIRVSVNYKWDISGQLDLGALCFIGNGVHIRCWDSMKIGELARIAVDCQLFDTNFHYTRNIYTGEVYRKNIPVVLGKCCWIGNRSTVMKGTHLPDYSIVAGNSLVNKDYSKDAPKYPLFAGSPAKVVSSGYVRILSAEIEGQIDAFFRENTDVKVYMVQPGEWDEYMAVKKDFRG